MALKPNHKDELENKKYRNWVKAGLSLKYLKDGIGDFANECAKYELDRILQKLGLTGESSCNQCSLTTLRPAHAPLSKVKQCPIGQRHCNCLLNKTTSCPNNICGTIYDEIVDSHGTRSPNWKNTDITKWTTDPWEIAKCFINAPGNEATRSASDTDLAGLLHLFLNSTGFQRHMLCAINLFDKIKTWRNSLFHSPAMELEDQKLTDGINDILALLKDGKELKHKECSKHAIHKLKKIQEEHFIITTETEAEVCRTALTSINQRTGELKSIQEELKSIQKETKRDIDLRQEEANKDIALQQEKAMKNIALKQEEANKDIALKQEKAKKEIALKQEEAKKYIALKQDEAVQKVQNAADSYKSHLQMEMSELCATVKTHELEIKSLNMNVNKVQQDVEKLKHVKDNKTEHLKKIENIIALKSKLKERYRTYYIRTSPSPLKTTENDIEISQVYVPPNMTKVTEITSEEGEKKECTVRILDYRKIFLKDDKPNKRMYILGDVGSGKSAFCKMMMRNWCLSSEVQCESAEEDVRTLGQFELLFYLPLRIFTDDDSLLDMLTWYYEDICTKDNLLNILQLIPERCLVLADGIDEWKPKAVERRRAHETDGLPTTDKMDHVTIMMTSRPSAQGILYMDKSNYDVKVRLDGIGEQYVETLIKKLYPKSQPENIIRKLRHVPIKDLEKTPLLLQQIVWLLQQNIDIGKSISEVYSNVVNIAFRWNQKHTEKDVLGHTHSAASKFTELSFPDQIKNNYPEFISHSSVIFGLGKMAFEIMTQGSQLSFGTIELNKHGIDEYLRTKMLGTGLLTEEVRFDNGKENTLFYFTHTSFLEYFAALYIASHKEEDIIFRRQPPLVARVFDTNSFTCHNTILGLITERCNLIQDVIRLENMLVILCGLVPSLTYNVCLLVYKTLKRNHIYERTDIPQLYNFSNELITLLYQCRNLVFRCVRECKVSDPHCTLKLPYFAVYIGNEWSREPEKTKEVMHYVDPLTVRCCISSEYYPAIVAVFQKLEVLEIKFEFADFTDNELSSLAEFIARTVTLRYIRLTNDNWYLFSESERFFRPPTIYKIDLSKLRHLRSLVLQKVIHIIFCNINTVNLTHCIIDGTKCSVLSTHAKSLIDLKMTEMVFNHNELSDWIKLINRSVLLKALNISEVSCSKHRKPCSHVLKLLHHNQLQTLEVFMFDGVCMHFKNVSTLKLESCDMFGAVASFSSEDTTTHCEFCLRSFSLKHNELLNLAKFFTRSVSLRKLTLNGIKCLNHDNCSQKIDLSRCAQLVYLSVDRPFSCDKINTSNLRIFSTDNAEVLQCLRDSVNLQTLTLRSLNYSMDVHDCVLTLPRLQQLSLYYINLKNVALVMIPEMKHLRKIELFDVNMTEYSWLQFLESILILRQSVECNVIQNAKHFVSVQYVKNYLMIQSDKFQLKESGNKLIFKTLK